MANPGQLVDLRTENLLKLADFCLRLQEKTACVVAPANINVGEIRSVIELRDADIAYENPKSTNFPVINDKNWPKTMESISEFLDSYLGEMKIPLGYVIHQSVALPEGLDSREKYATYAEDMIHCAPHDTPTFLSDNRKVWDIISSITCEEECWTYVKLAQRSHNGCVAFFMLYNHFLGANNVNNMASESEYKLANVLYHGKKKRWSFESYVRQQVDQHSILKGLKDHGH